MDEGAFASPYGLHLIREGCRFNPPNMCCDLFSFWAFFANMGEERILSGDGRSAGLGLIKAFIIFCRGDETAVMSVGFPCLSA